MNICWTTSLLLVLCLSDQIFQLTTAEEEDDHYVNEWAAEIPGGWHTAKRVAEEYGYEIKRAIEGIPNHYSLKRSDVPSRSRRSADHHTRAFSDDARVIFVEQQREMIRTKRTLQDREVALHIVQLGGDLDDPQFAQEWYLNKRDSEVMDSEDGVKEVMGVKAVWRKGITGKNVVVTIIDDGVEGNHTDLAENFDPDASYDFNGNDTDVTPRYDPTNENRHGTRCAGEVAMVANNHKCGVGIAFNSRIGGIRILDGKITDSLEADALSFNKNHIDIYSSSWGPTDNGQRLEKPGFLSNKALELGIKEGRGGKGSIFVWASGNGGHYGDNCNCDGYVASIYTTTVSSVTKKGSKPWYGEKCASTLTTTYSSGSHGGNIVAADLHDKCTSHHSGTSASAPMAAGVIALLLETNPDLNWREVQHLIVHTSRPQAMERENGWYQNGVGYCVNLAFGFGLIDALAMVELGDPKKWKQIPEQHICLVEPKGHGSFPIVFKSGEFVEVEFITDGCRGQTNEINFLEHIEVIIGAKYMKRGNMFAEIISPMGTTTSLMIERVHDTTNKSIDDWPLMSVHTWGESPQGTWQFRIGDRSDDGMINSLGRAILKVYGTKDKPAYRKDPIIRCKLSDNPAGYERNSNLNINQRGSSGYERNSNLNINQRGSSGYERNSNLNINQRGSSGYQSYQGSSGYERNSNLNINQRGSSGYERNSNLNINQRGSSGYQSYQGSSAYQSYQGSSRHESDSYANRFLYLIKGYIDYVL